MQLLSHLENKFDEILRGELLCSLSRLAALLCEHDVEIIEAERSGTRLRGSATAESELTQVVRRQLLSNTHDVRKQIDYCAQCIFGKSLKPQDITWDMSIRGGVACCPIPRLPLPENEANCTPDDSRLDSDIHRRRLVEVWFMRIHAAAQLGLFRLSVQRRDPRSHRQRAGGRTRRRSYGDTGTSFGKLFWCVDSVDAETG
mmetsp:Transcript_5095/g.11214  ORF Transcript_5095/g.11214 Transcript_5095/m.11214 type:complete len:201 (+) Transcript_5095:86-688(+)